MGKDGMQSVSKKPWSGKSLAIPTIPRKVPLIPSEDKKGLPYLTFSFRYCSQQEYFGFGDQGAPWFANLLERVQDLSNKTASILDNHIERGQYRLHPIDWNAKGCPITIDDLTSVPKQIIDNIEDDFFWQFQLSKGTGRVIGFFNENLSVFYIVLLDPNHNAQPSKFFGYSVNDTKTAITEYEKIQMLIEDADNKRKKRCKSDDICPFSNIAKKELRSDVFYASIDNELKDKYIELIEAGTFQSKFEEFLLENL